jgi:hypothetical protein
MPSKCSAYLRRATTSVLVAVALVSGGILLVGDRFDVAPGYALTESTRLSTRIAACVADENMRLINPDQERCRPGEIQLASERAHPSAEPGPPAAAGQAVADGTPAICLTTR